MPCVLRCKGCQQEHLIRDQFVGRLVRCDCQRTQTVPSDAPSVPASTSLLDAPVVQVGSVGMLLVSVLVLGGVIAWVVGLDAAPAPPTTKPTSNPTTPTTRPDKPTERTPPSPPKTPKTDPKLLALLEQLKSSDLETNTQAIIDLEKLDDDSLARQVIPAVVAAAKQQPDEDFRRKAATRLKVIGPPLKKDYKCLKEALLIPHPALQDYVVFALKDLGDQARSALDVLVEALKHRNPDVRGKAFAILKDLPQPARVPVFRLLFNPSGDADEEASLDVLKTLLDDSNALTSDEMDVLAETLRDVKKRINVRCFAVVHVGKGEQAIRAIPALVDVMREKGNAKLLTLSIEALGGIGDKRKEVLTSLLTVAASAGEEDIRLQSLRVVEQLDSSALSTAQVLERWTAENSSAVKKELDKMLQSRLARLKPERMMELRPLLHHKEAEIVLVALNVVQTRKEEAVSVAATVADLLEDNNAKVRAEALNALEAIGPAVEKTLPKLAQRLLDHWDKEKDSAVQQALTKLLLSRLMLLKPEQMKELRAPLSHKDTTIIRVGLRVVQTRREEAADVAKAVADLLDGNNAKVREEALNALEAIGPAAEKTLPKLSQMLLDRWGKETESAVQKALTNLLESRFAKLKREKLKDELLPLLHHKDADIVLVGLKAVQTRKEEAAEVAEELPDLLNAPTAKNVRAEALAALKALGPTAKKALPKLFQLLKKTPRSQRAPLALTVAFMVDPQNSENVKLLVPFLLDGLLDQSLQVRVAPSEGAIDGALLKFGQSAVDSILEVVSDKLGDKNASGKLNSHFRKRLYAALEKLGPKCQSTANYESIRKLWIKEANIRYNDDLIKSAIGAMKAIDPE